MELVAHYQEIHKKKNPWLEWFLKTQEPIPEYQRKLVEALGRGQLTSVHMGRNPMFRLARGSGKTGAQMAMIERALDESEWRRMAPEPVRAFRVSPELQEDMRHSDAMTEAMNMITRQAAEAMERRIYNQIMYGQDVEPIRTIEFENGSRIQAMQSANTIRATREPLLIEDIEEFRRTFGLPRLPEAPPEFQQEYLARWVGDTDGDVPSIHDDSSEQA